MQLVIIVMIVSFFLESMVSNLISIDSQLLIPLFTIVSLVIIYPYFKKDHISYLKTAAVLGLFYDIVFTDTLIVNLFLFVFTAWFIHKMNYLLSNNYFNVAIMTMLAITFYRIISFIALILIGYLHFSVFALLRGITSSLLLNVIYAIIVYAITDHISRKHHIVKID
ncbi:MAG: rod shape-determining protein MreD [Firmicutes bacterium]|nr:rod shape-determining protein MreD [Bacillota bacterium]